MSPSVNTQAMTTLKLTLAGAFAATLIFCTGCSNQPIHPNQINSFDGATYDSLTVAHAALVSLRASVTATHQQYTMPFNEAVQTYATAYSAYATYRAAQSDEPALVLALANLTTSIRSLEQTLQTDMKASPADMFRAKAQAEQFHASIGRRFSVSQILTDLEVAAAVAAAIPATQPYSTIAQIVLQMANDALAAFGASSGQPIDLSTIQPIAPIQ